MRPIVVLGAGSWGTALAIQFARGGGPTVLWGRAEDEPEKLARERENVRYLPGAKFPPSLADRARPREGARAAATTSCSSCPRASLRAVLTQIKPLLGPQARIAWASKGFELVDRQAARTRSRAKCWARTSRSPCSPARRSRRKSARACRPRSRSPPRRGFRARARGAHFVRRLSRLHPVRHRRRRDRRRGQERARDRDRLLRRARLWLEQPRVPDHARARRAHAARRRARREARDADGPRRPRRPRAHLHRRPVAQPPLRPRARGGQAGRRRRSRRSARWSRAITPRKPCTRWRRSMASTCRSAGTSTKCCTARCRSRKSSSRCSRGKSRRRTDQGDVHLESR